MVLLEQHTASASASLNFTTAISATYDEYLIEFVNIIPATNAVNFWMRMSTNGGSSYDSGTNYSWTAYGMNRFGAAQAGVDATNQIILNKSTIDNTSTKGLCGFIRLYSPGSTSVHKDVVGEAMGFVGRRCFGSRQSGRLLSFNDCGECIPVPHVEWQHHVWHHPRLRHR
jgi:hypothetical protein